MAVNYMDRLAALRGDRQHAAGARGGSSAPVLHADEASKKKRKGKKKLSRKQKAALAKGRKVMAQMRREKKMGKRKKSSKRGSSKRRASKRGGYKTAAGRRTARIAKFHMRARKAGKRVRKRKHKGVTTYTFAPKRRAPKRSRKHPKKRKHAMARKSSKRSRAAKKAARTRKHNKEIRRAAARKAARSRKRHGGGRKRSGHKRRRAAHKRPAHRRRKRGGRARRRYKGLVRRSNRSGKFVGKGGRIHGRKRRGGYHRAGRIVREGYSMENPLEMSELATGLITGLIGFIAADVTDRYLAGSRPPLAGTLYAPATPIYSDYVRLAVGLAMGAVPLVGAHFIDGAKRKHLRAGLQFFGFGAGLRTLGHLFNDVVAATLKNNSMVGSTVQALYPHEIISQAQLAGAQAAMAKTGAAGLPEQIGAEALGMGAIPEGLGACCNASSRMLNSALSPLQPIGRSAEGGGAAANYAPPPVALPPPIEQIVRQPYAPPSTTRQAAPVPMTPAVPAQPQLTPQQPQLPARVPAAMTPGTVSMAAAYAPVAPAGAQPSFVGPAGLPASPFAWAEE